MNKHVFSAIEHLGTQKVFFFGCQFRESVESWYLLLCVGLDCFLHSLNLCTWFKINLCFLSGSHGKAAEVKIGTKHPTMPLVSFAPCCLVLDLLELRFGTSGWQRASSFLPFHLNRSRAPCACCCSLLCCCWPQLLPLQMFCISTAGFANVCVNRTASCQGGQDGNMGFGWHGLHGAHHLPYSYFS